MHISACMHALVVIIIIDSWLYMRWDGICLCNAMPVPAGSTAYVHDAAHILLVKTFKAIHACTMHRTIYTTHFEYTLLLQHGHCP